MKGFGFQIDDNFNQVVSLIESPVDYFDFPSSLIAFAESLQSSSLFIYNGCFFRRRNKHLTLITYIIKDDQLLIVIDDLQAKGYIIKFLNFVNKGKRLPNKNYMLEFWIDKNWDIENTLQSMNSKHRGNLKRELSKCKQKYSISTKLNKNDVLDLFYKWYDGAQHRHFMVIKGHYLQYIENYFKYQRNVHFISFIDSTNCLQGVAGFEIYKNKAQITIMKHIFTDKNFPSYFWTETLNYILSFGVEKVFCGTTADKLKTRLGLSSTKSHKLVL